MRRAAPVLRLPGRVINVDGTLVMGVVNASPESFSDAGRFASPERQIQHCQDLVDAGADVIDIGGQSAITNQPELEPSLERDRVLPVVEWMHAHHPGIILSVDTYKPLVVDAVLAAGADLINDVSGLAHPRVAASCARHGAALVLMHTRARPKQRLQRADLYADPGSDVLEFMIERSRAAGDAGLPKESIVLDPGPDFAKTPHQTVAVLRRLEEVHALGRPVLLALSRKDFLGAVTGRSPKGRDAATAAAIAFFVAATARTGGGNIVRVHDVAAARDVIATIEVLAGRRDLDPQYLLPDALRHESTAHS
jgi:dihydropteroate synthase